MKRLLAIAGLILLAGTLTGSVLLTRGSYYFPGIVFKQDRTQTLGIDVNSDVVFGDAAQDANKLVWSSDGTWTFVSEVAIGTAGTDLTQIRVYAETLTPSATAAAIGVTEETFTVTGLATSDIVTVNGPAPTALCPTVSARVSAANTLALSFATLTAAACTPVAGTYNIVAIRS